MYKEVQIINSVITDVFLNLLSTVQSDIFLPCNKLQIKKWFARSLGISMSLTIKVT